MCVACRGDSLQLQYERSINSSHFIERRGLGGDSPVRSINGVRTVALLGTELLANNDDQGGFIRGGTLCNYRTSGWFFALSGATTGGRVEAA